MSLRNDLLMAADSGYKCHTIHHKELNSDNELYKLSSPSAAAHSSTTTNNNNNDFGNECFI